MSGTALGPGNLSTSGGHLVLPHTLTHKCTHTHTHMFTHGHTLTHPSPGCRVSKIVRGEKQSWEGQSGGGKPLLAV